MKKIALFFALSFSIVLFANAQQKQPTAEEIAKKNIDELTEKLSLSATQKSIVYSYAFNLAKEQLALYKKQQVTGYNDEEMTKYYKLQNETHKNIKKFLQPDQIIGYDKIVEDRLNGVDTNKKKKKTKKADSLVKSLN